jgi:hypothetical protein
MTIDSPKSKRSPPVQALSSAIPTFFQSGKMICYISLYILSKYFFGQNWVDRFSKSAIFLGRVYQLIRILNKIDNFSC